MTTHTTTTHYTCFKPPRTRVRRASGFVLTRNPEIVGLCSPAPAGGSELVGRSKKGRPSLPRDLERIDLRHFAELMDRFADYLDGLDTATSVLEEQKLDMEAEWRSEMLSEG